jgi:hypothetical protein
MRRQPRIAVRLRAPAAVPASVGEGGAFGQRYPRLMIRRVKFD